MQDEVQQHRAAPRVPIPSRSGRGPSRYPLADEAERLLFRPDGSPTPFKPQGRTIENGLDCAGVLVLALLGSGYPLREDWLTTEYPATGDASLLEAALSDIAEPVDDPQRDDIVVFSIFGYECHAGILSRPNRAIHAWFPNRKVVEHDLAGKWAERVAGYYRCK